MKVSGRKIEASSVNCFMMMVLPFETLWMRARAGRLQAGDMAPDFSLPTLDHTATVQLSSFRGSQPVVLVFGSYT